MSFYGRLLERRKRLLLFLVVLLVVITGCTKGGSMEQVDYCDDFSDPRQKDLIKAVMNGDSQKVRDLARKGVDLNAVGAYENTSLWTALKIGQKESVKTLLDLGVSPNMVTPEGVAAAKNAITSQRDTWFLQTLLQYGLDPNLKSEETPLIFYAVTEGRWRHYDMLLTNGADINSLNSNGSSLLLDLVMQLEYDRAKDLLLKGADFRTVSMTGLNVLDELVDYQRRFCKGPTPDCYKRAELLKLMQERGMEIPPGLPFM